MSVRVFGRLDGVDIPEVTIAADGIEARIITWGAVLRDLVVASRDGPRRVVLGLGTIEDYVAHSPNFGAVVGRVANRIGGARFPLDGRIVELVPNEGPNQLHGGPRGFGKRVWSLIGHDATRVHLGLVSEDGDMGYPGRLHASATYEVEPGSPDRGPILRFSLAAFADRPTPVNLTVHNYFNLDGAADARDHVLQIEADHHVVLDPAQIPTGEIARVERSPDLDFRRERPIRPSAPDHLYDLNYVLRREGGPGLARAATLSSPKSGLRMQLWTTEPGLQLYDAHKVNVAVPGHDGARYGRFAGIALEPQRFPDAPNHAHFPSCRLEPGEVSRQVSELRFGPLE